jgi:hypothetical protein
MELTLSQDTALFLFQMAPHSVPMAFLALDQVGGPGEPLWFGKGSSVVVMRYFHSHRDLVFSLSRALNSQL